MIKSQKVNEAQTLPSVSNLNPRSLYNKIDEFHEFVINEEIDVTFLSESWERSDLNLKDIVSLPDYEVISNPSQRKGTQTGGRPALVVNKKKFHVKDITNTLAIIPWGVEAVWCLLTPLNVTNKSKIQKIACCAFYCKPDSRKKTELLDHISDVFHLLSKKYANGLHFILAGDANTLKLDSILSLSPNMTQIVQDYTRMNPPRILDPVITTLASWYQKPQCVAPLDCDKDKKGKSSDHKIVIVKPLSSGSLDSARITRKIKVRPFPASGIEKMRTWMIDYKWNEVFEAVTAHEKADCKTG